MIPSSSPSPDTTTPPIGSDGRIWVARLNHLAYWLSRRWLLILIVTLGVWVGLPWLAPVFMKLG